MQVKRFVGSVFVVAGLLSGCGVEEASLEEPTALESREDALVPCYGYAYNRIFYKEAAMINQVGEWYCICGEDGRRVYGYATAYYKEPYRYACDTVE